MRRRPKPTRGLSRQEREIKNFSYNNYYKALVGYLSYPELLQKVHGLKLHILKGIFFAIEWH
jgi:hypothetical protein